MKFNYCPQCGKQLNEHTDLSLHRTMHLYTCKYCNIHIFEELASFRQLSEYEYRYMTDKEYAKQVRQQDRQNKIDMEKAYSEAYEKYKDTTNYIDYFKGEDSNE